MFENEIRPDNLPTSWCDRQFTKEEMDIMWYGGTIPYILGGKQDGYFMIVRDLEHPSGYDIVCYWGRPEDRHTYDFGKPFLATVFEKRREEERRNKGF